MAAAFETEEGMKGCPKWKSIRTLNEVNVRQNQLVAPRPCSEDLTSWHSPTHQLNLSAMTLGQLGQTIPRYRVLRIEQVA